MVARSVIMSNIAQLKVNGLNNVQSKLNKIKVLVLRGNKKAFVGAGKLGIKIITERTLDGKDYKNNSFKKYSKKYADAKGSTHVDLFRSGKMLKAMDYQTFAKGLRIYVKKKTHDGKLNTYNLAVVQNFGANAGKNHTAKIPKREFMGLNDKDIKRILALVRAFFDREIKRIF